MNQTNTMDAPSKRAFRNPLDILILAIARRFGGKSKEVERFLKFAIVGFIGAIIDFGTVFILQATIIPPVGNTPVFQIGSITLTDGDMLVILASTIGFCAAVLSNFIWNRYWTYPDSRSRSIRRQLVQFSLINIVGWLIRTIWVKTSYLALGVFLMPILIPEIQIFRPGYVPSEHAVAKLGTMAALLIGVCVVMIWNFTANRLWTYSDVK